MWDAMDDLFWQDTLFSNMMQLTAATLLFSSVFEKKPGYGRRAALCLAAAFLFSFAENGILGVPIGLAAESAAYPLFCVIGTLFVGFCVTVRWRGILFSVFCGITTQQVASALLMLVRIMLIRRGISQNIVFRSIPLAAVLLVGIYLPVYEFVVKKIQEYGIETADRSGSILAIFLFLPLVVVLNIVSRIFSSNYDNNLILACFQMFVMVNGIYILWMLVYHCRTVSYLRDMHKEEAIIRGQRLQYEQSMQNIDGINRKYHDLKHQLSAIRHMSSTLAQKEYIHELEQEILIYDAFIYTGNEVLDVVLTEKNLYCRQHGIVLACVADGPLLEKIEVIDLYTMLGNALDNAIECVEKIEDSGRRYISFKAFAWQEFVEIQVENFCDAPVIMADGLPVTSKADKSSHGFGLSSIKKTAEKYQGCMTVQLNDGMFCLEILIPQRFQKEQTDLSNAPDI